MFAKVFEQIFESSIAEDCTLRHVFMDLLVLADLDGVVDKTHEAIARRTNVPLDIITKCIAELEAPDPKSRNEKEEGRRLIRLDDHRDWGWQIVNYLDYKSIRDEEARRAYFRDRKRIQRARAKESNQSTNGHLPSKDVQSCLGQSNDVTHTDTDTDTENYSPNSASSGDKRIKLASPDFWQSLKSDPDYAGIDFDEERRKMALWKKVPRNSKRQITESFVRKWLAKADRQVELPSVQRSLICD